jgi:hypothetical protein
MNIRRCSIAGAAAAGEERAPVIGLSREPA